MSDLHLKSCLVETSCSHIMKTIKSLPLNYNIVETPYSIYLTLRKSLLKGAQSFEIPEVVKQDEKVTNLDKANAYLSASLEEAVIDSEEKANTIYKLEETVQNLLEKLENSEKINLKEHEELKTLKDEEIDNVKVKNKNLVSENKTLRKDLKNLTKELDLFKCESLQSKRKLESKIELLEKRFEDQKSETEAVLSNIENERAELKLLREKFFIVKKEVPSQTLSNPDVPYLVTDPLPPIFSSQLCFKSRPIHFLSRSMPNLNSILWCPPDDEDLDAAEEFLAEQYDREIEEFYLEAREQARVKHVAGQHGHLEQQGVPGEHHA